LATASFVRDVDGRRPGSHAAPESAPGSDTGDGVPPAIVATVALVVGALVLGVALVGWRRRSSRGGAVADDQSDTSSQTSIAITVADFSKAQLAWDSHDGSYPGPATPGDFNGATAGATAGRGSAEASGAAPRQAHTTLKARLAQRKEEAGISPDPAAGIAPPTRVKEVLRERRLSNSSVPDADAQLGSGFDGFGGFGAVISTLGKAAEGSAAGQALHAPTPPHRASPAATDGDEFHRFGDDDDFDDFDVATSALESASAPCDLGALEGGASEPTGPGGPDGHFDDFDIATSALELASAPCDLGALEGGASELTGPGGTNAHDDFGGLSSSDEDV